MNKQNTEMAYTMGRSQEETERLIQQSGLYEEITQRFLRDAGLFPGMRFLISAVVPGMSLSLPQNWLVVMGKLSRGYERGDSRNSPSTSAGRGPCKRPILGGRCPNARPSERFRCPNRALGLDISARPRRDLETARNASAPGGIVAFQEVDFTLYSSTSHQDTPMMTS